MIEFREQPTKMDILCIVVAGSGIYSSTMNDNVRMVCISRGTCNVERDDDEKSTRYLVFLSCSADAALPLLLQSEATEHKTHSMGKAFKNPFARIIVCGALR